MTKNMDAIVSLAKRRGFMNWSIGLRMKMFPILEHTVHHAVYISGGSMCTIKDMADIVREIIPDAQITTGDQLVPHVYNLDNSRMLADIGYEIAPLRQRILDHINDARTEAGMDIIAG